MSRSDPPSVADSGEPPPRARKRLILAILVLSQLLVWVDNTILGIALETLADPGEGLGATPGELQWAVGGYTLVFATFMFAGGALGDRLGHRTVLVAGLVLFGGASLWAAYAGGIGQLIAARAAMGLGSALVMPATMAILAWTFTGADRLWALGVFSASSGVGLTAGPLIAGVLLDRFWWGSVFLINVPVVIGGLLGALTLVPDFRSGVTRRLDLLGLALSTAGLGVVAYGLIGAGSSSWRLVDVAALIVVGLLLLAVFVIVESRTVEPSFNPRLFKDGRFLGGHIALGALFMSLAGHMFYSALYIQGARGLSPLAAGIAGTPAAVGVMLGAPLSPRLVRRWSVGTVTTPALTAAAVTFGLFGLLGLHTSLVWYGLVIFVQGVAIGLVIAPVTSAVLGRLPLDQAGAGSAVNNAVRQSGGLFGIAFLGAVLSAVYRRGMTEPAAAVPAPVREQVLVSAESARDAATTARLPDLVAAANDSFIHAMRVASGWAMGISLLGAGALWITFVRPARFGAFGKLRARAGGREAGNSETVVS